jgi:hypothetical protein
MNNNPWDEVIKEIRDRLGRVEECLTSISGRLDTLEKGDPKPLLAAQDIANTSTTPPELGENAIVNEAYPTSPPALPEWAQVSPNPIESTQKQTVSLRRAESLELKLGTVWFVRAGIVLLLTGLVFLGNYLYSNYFNTLGAYGRVGILYLGASFLIGVGLWLEKRQKQLHQFSRVILAGGLGAVYYVTFAAHTLPWLRMIPNPIVAALLLFFWTLFMIWLAERRQSQLMAIFAILLSYFACTVAGTYWFTLMGNLILAFGAMALLIKHRWLTLSYTSFLATYGSFVFWNFYRYETSGSQTGFGLTATALISYWLLFTGFILFSQWPQQGESFARDFRRIFALLNNGICFGLLLWARRHAAVSAATVSAIAGAILLGLGAWLFLVVSRNPSKKPVLQRLASEYIEQGVIACTLALIFKFSDSHYLILIMAIESALLTYANANRSLVLRCLAFLLGLGAALVTSLSDCFSSFSGGKVGFTEFLPNLIAAFFLGINGYRNSKIEDHKKNWIESYGFALWIAAIVIVGTSQNFNVQQWVLIFSALGSLLIVAGFLLRNRIYRLAGLLVLGAALVKLFVVDIWTLGMLYRISSLFVLGAILTLLGFLYARYQETIKKWL